MKKMTTKLYMNLYGGVLRNVIDCFNDQLMDEIESKSKSEEFDFKIEEIKKALDVYNNGYVKVEKYVNMLEFYKNF